MRPTSMDPTGQHLAHLAHVDHSMSQSLIASLAMTTPLYLAVADKLLSLISGLIITVLTTLIVGKINRTLARREAEAQLAALKAAAVPASVPPPPR